MSEQIKAIKTVYKGLRFRSRLEARCAERMGELITREELAKISAERINMLKNDKDVSFRDIERETGLAHSSVRALTLGQHVPSGYAIVKLSEFFGVSADFILGMSEDLV